MKPNPPPAKKKLSMKTRLVLIVGVFVMVNLIFYVGLDGSEDSQDGEEIEQESGVMEETVEETVEEIEEERVYAKFNAPKP